MSDETPPPHSATILPFERQKKPHTKDASPASTLRTVLTLLALGLAFVAIEYIENRGEAEQFDDLRYDYDAAKPGSREKCMLTRQGIYDANLAHNPAMISFWQKEQAASCHYDNSNKAVTTEMADRKLPPNNTEPQSEPTTPP